jgi:hypothetical protein
LPRSADAGVEDGAGVSRAGVGCCAGLSLGVLFSDILGFL